MRVSGYGVDRLMIYWSQLGTWEHVCRGWVRRFCARVRAWEHIGYVIFGSYIGNFFYALVANKNGNCRKYERKGWILIR